MTANVNDDSETNSPGRDESVAVLFDGYYRSLRGLAVVILGDTAAAEEAVMEAFVKLYSRWGSLARLDRPSIYLRRMVINECRSRLRRRRIEVRVNELLHRRDERKSPPAPGLDEAMDLWAAVRSLPERQRLCVVLRYVEDLPEREIAELLDRSVGTIKSQLFKARQKLERLLARRDDGGETP